MKQRIVYVGLDIDDTQYHGSAFNKDTGEIIDFHCRPTLKGLLRQLEKLGQHFSGCTFRVCDEASYLGSRPGTVKKGTLPFFNMSIRTN